MGTEGSCGEAWEGGTAPARMLLTVGIHSETGKQEHILEKPCFPTKHVGKAVHPLLYHGENLLTLG